jgi:hypothetical protein
LDDVSDPVLIDTGLQMVCAKWNNDGSILATAGQKPGDVDFGYIHFYDPFGEVFHPFLVHFAMSFVIKISPLIIHRLHDSMSLILHHLIV